MRSYLYLSTAVAGVMMTAGVGASYAQCVTTQNCAELGYTETSCPDGTGIKCPFGDTFACTGGSCATDCAELGFTYPCTGANETGGSGKSCGGKYQSCTCTSPYTWSGSACTCPSTYQYTCSGTGYSGGSGTACGGKYTSCTCASGYEWKDGACSVSAVSCTIGTLYYSDGKCYNQKVDSKTLLGVVIMEKTTSASGWIMTISPIQNGIAWDTGSYYSTGITDTAASASCTNTQKLVALGSRFAAANAANNYKPSGTPSGKSWCLPSYGLLNNINNSTNFAKVNAGITTAGGTKLGYGGQPYDSYEYVWSSSEYSDDYAWYVIADTSGSFGMYNGSKNRGNKRGSVRPVLEF